MRIPTAPTSFLPSPRHERSISPRSLSTEIPAEGPLIPSLGAPFIRGKHRDRGAIPLETFQTRGALARGVRRAGRRQSRLGRRPAAKALRRRDGSSAGNAASRLRLGGSGGGYRNRIQRG